MESRLRRSRVALAAAVALIVAACATTTRAPIEERSLNVPPRAPSAAPAGRDNTRDGTSYRVVRGDTLYSIAFRNGLDYRELAAANGIAAPYTIYVGQSLKLGAAAAQPRPVAPATPVIAARPNPPVADASVPASIAARAPPPRSAADVSRFENVEPGALTNAPPPVASAPPQLSAAITAAPPPPPPSTPPPPPTPVKAPEPITATGPGEVGWHWPADGSIVGGFVAADPTKQGIDIAGKAGDPVRAAADGTVVYSGNGLIGYGELIIVKHSASLLSAYGHNSKRLVKEGDRVKAGQVIAEMGSSSASRDSLHFEIRKNGKPTNPTDYLPRR